MEAEVGPQFVAGVDLGGTNMTIGVVDDAGRVLATCKRKTKARQGLDSVLERLSEGLRRACESAGLPPTSIAAVGVGVPSAVDIPRGVALKSGNLGWEDVPVRDLLVDRLGVPVAVDNDVNMAAWGEAVAGAGRGCRSLLAVWVGTGIGGGLVLNGHLFHGAFWTAGELGQMIIAPEAGPGRSTLEEVASRSAMTTAIRRLLPAHPNSVLHELLREREEDDPRDPIGSGTIAEAYRRGDDLTTRIVEHSADVVGLAIANAITMLALDTVVLGGGVVEALGGPYLERVRRMFDRSVFPDSCRRCELRMGELGDHAAVIGAAMLARGGLRAGAGGVPHDLRT